MGPFKTPVNVDYLIHWLFNCTSIQLTMYPNSEYTCSFKLFTTYFTCQRADLFHNFPNFLEKSLKGPSVCRSDENKACQQQHTILVFHLANLANRQKY